MDPFLDELRRQGSLDSTGHFSVDYSRALEQLARYQLPDPRRAILQVVRSAVLSGAAWLRIKVGLDEVEAEFPGVLAPSEEMPSLLTWLFDPGLSPARARLAVGLLAAAEAEVTSWDGQRCARVRLSQGPTVKGELGSEPPWIEPRTRVRLVKPRKHGPFESLKRSLGGSLIERDLVRQLCRHAPLRLELNHAELSPPPLVGDGQLRIFCPDPTAVAIRMPAPPVPQRVYVTRTVAAWPPPPAEESLAGSQGVLVAAVSLSWDGQLVPIREGVVLEENSRPTAVVSAAGLQLDLSGEKLVEGQLEALREILKGYRALLK